MFGRVLFLIVLLGIFSAIIIFVAQSRFQYSSPLSKPSPQQSQNTPADTPRLTLIAQNLDSPWSMVFIPNESQEEQQRILFTQRPGSVWIVENKENETPQQIASIDSVVEVGEGGLLGVTIHPKFTTNHYLYFYYTYQANGSNTLNRVVRYTLQDSSLSNPTIIVDRIPGASNHNGGRIKFGPDGYLYIGTGDAQEPSLSQNKNSLAGKILRVNDSGQPAPGNPYNNRTYSYGHRNVQGLTWDEENRMWATEHGRSGIQSGYDELNQIIAGGNYGWPEIEGDESGQEMISPTLHSGARTTWAPSGAAFLNGSVFFTGLRGQSLYEAKLQDDQATLIEYFHDELGRIRDVIVGPDAMLYILTNNTDGRGTPQGGDDKLLRINPNTL